MVLWYYLLISGIVYNEDCRGKETPERVTPPSPAQFFLVIMTIRSKMGHDYEKFVRIVI
jgi:hypothetical protein